MNCYLCGREPPAGRRWPVRPVDFCTWDGKPGTIREYLCDGCHVRQEAERAEQEAKMAAVRPFWQQWGEDVAARAAARREREAATYAQGWQRRA